jgi:hypothetical protein
MSRAALAWSAPAKLPRATVSVGDGASHLILMPAVAMTLPHRSVSLLT